MAVKNPTIRFNTLIEQLEDEHSLINCVPPEIKSKLLEIPEKYLNKSEEELLELFDSEPNCRFTPSATNDALRNNFWIEFDRAQSDRKSPVMIINNFIGGVVLSSHVQYITVEQWAYIICKPPTYEAVMAGMQSLATRRLRDILSLPLHKKDGSLNDPKHIELILRAAAMVDLRNRGGYIARVETKNVTQIDQRTTSVSHVFNANYGTNNAELTEKDINQKIRELDEHLAQIPEPAKPKFADAIEVESVPVER